jgi:hypothetical protein
MALNGLHEQLISYYLGLSLSDTSVISRFTFKNRVPRCPVNYVEWVKQTINITYEISNQKTNTNSILITLLR